MLLFCLSWDDNLQAERVFWPDCGGETARGGLVAAVFERGDSLQTLTQLGVKETTDTTKTTLCKSILQIYK